MKHKHFQGGFHHIGLLLALIVVGVVGLVGWRVISGQNPDGLAKYPKGPCGIIDTSAEVVPAPKLDPVKFKALGYDFVHGQWRNLLDEGHELGANAVIIHVDAYAAGKSFQLGECENGSPQKILGSAINMAHQNGFLVKLREAQYPTRERSELTTSQEVTDAYVAFWKKIGQIARRYNVYSVVLSGELDNTWASSLQTAPVWTDITGTNLTPLAQETLTALRNVYSGKIGVGLGGPQNIYDKDQAKSLNLKGYDFFEFSAYPETGDTTTEAYFTNLPKLLAVVEAIAQANGISEIHLGETGVLNPDGKLPGALDWSTATISEDLEARFYDRLFDQTYDRLDGYNIGYFQKYFSPRDEPGQAVLDKWFSKSAD